MTDRNEDLSTRERILNASESLFAELGFDGVSLRMITQRAGVELALANYHFGPKKDLFSAVVERRALELNEARRTALESLGPTPALEDLIDAFTRPFLEKGAPDGRVTRDSSRRSRTHRAGPIRSWRRNSIRLRACLSKKRSRHYRKARSRTSTGGFIFYSVP